MKANSRAMQFEVNRELAKCGAIAFAVGLSLTLLSRLPGPIGAMFGKALEENQAPIWSLLSLIACAGLLAGAWGWLLFKQPSADFFNFVRKVAVVLLGTSFALCGVQFAVCLVTWSVHPWGLAMLAASLMFNYTFAVEAVLAASQVRKRIAALQLAYHSSMLFSLIFVARRVAVSGWQTLSS